MQRLCIQCGTITPNPRRCDRCQPTTGSSWNQTRDRQKQAVFRRHVLERDGHQCAYTYAGRRCTATTNLQAHHTTPGSWDPADGITLCRTHHKTLDPKAR